MPPPLRDPKLLGEWLELDYFRRPRRLRTLRFWLTVAVLLKCVLLLLLTLWPRAHVLFQAGPVATAHIMFGNTCSQCHTETFQTVGRLLPNQTAVPAVPDAACKRCHEGPLHQEQQVHQPSCASCHQEHRGRPTLARVADEHCTVCHAQLARKDGGPPRFRNVHSFSRDHPEFALWRDPQPRDPINLRFNHQVHLQAQGVLGADGQAVKLDCRSCHQPDAEQRYMLPVRYPQHCAACHPLSVRLRNDWTDERTLAAAKRFREEPAPHQAPAIVRAMLRERLMQFFLLLVDGPADADNRAAERPLPGRSRVELVPGDENGWVKYQLNTVEKLLFGSAGSCRFCHLPKEPWQPQHLPDYLPTEQRSRWFPQSVFSHASHRQLMCSACHSNAAESRHSSDVLLPKSDSCRQCHNPQVGVRAQCVDCHRYHDRDPERSWHGKLSVGECLGRP
jgi:hypothetical protein